MLFIKTGKYFVQDNMKLVLNPGVMMDSIEEVALDRAEWLDYVKTLDEEV